MEQVIEILIHVKQGSIYLHSQYQGCSWPGHARSQAISCLGIDLNIPEYLTFSTKRYIGWQYIILQLQVHLMYWGLNKMANILETHFSNAFFLNFFFSFDSNFTGLFPKAQLTVDKHWFRYWLGNEQVTSHYLNQQWSSSLSDLLAILAGLNELIKENIWIFRNFPSPGNRLMIINNGLYKGLVSNT